MSVAEMSEHRNIMPYLLFLKKPQNLKLSSAANSRWRFVGKHDVGTDKDII